MTTSSFRNNPFRFVLLVGVMSLFADMTYEGARSITGPYLALLGASVAAVGVIAGVGELLGYVTHMYDLGHSVYTEARSDSAFLRAERLADGTRTFRLVPGEPLPTSHGLDLYRRIFGKDVDSAPVATRSDHRQLHPRPRRHRLEWG